MKTMEIKIIITKNNWLERLESRFELAEQKIANVNSLIENMQSQEKREKRLKKY